MNGATTPVLSIVVAAVNPSATLSRWLTAIAPQIHGRNVEVLLAGADDDPAATEGTTGIVRIPVPKGALVPAMWGAGILNARGGVIAVTISACTPERNWVAAILDAHAAPHAAIGGAIDHASDGGLVDRALHLVRYTPYLPPLTAGPVIEVAGDNGTYKRAALESFLPSIARDGFWEADVNRELRARGDTLWIDPRILVRHARSYSAAGFSRQRFVHGRVFGRARRAGSSSAVRAARVILAPVVPVLMLARNLRTTAARGRLDVRTLVAAPLAFWFLICWVAGEAMGQIGG